MVWKRLVLKSIRGVRTFFSLPRQIARRIDRTYERFLYLVSSLLPLIGSRV